jgi:hypothetical protein
MVQTVDMFFHQVIIIDTSPFGAELVSGANCVSESVSE